MRFVILLVAAIGLVALTACRDDDADVRADACTELNELQQSVAALEALGPNATVGQLKDATGEVRENAQDAARAVRRVQEARYETLRDAQDDLKKAVDGIDDDQSIAQVIAQIQPQLAAVMAARQDLVSSLNCP